MKIARQITRNKESVCHFKIVQIALHSLKCSDPILTVSKEKLCQSMKAFESPIELKRLSLIDVQ